MNDPRGAFRALTSQSESDRAQVSDLMRQALAAINQGQLPGGALTAESVEQLARNLGATDAEQIATLQRMMMLSPAGASPAEVAAQHILFLLGDIECALPSEAVQGVERAFEVTPVPNVAPWVLGVTQMWGSIISVVDLRGFLGLPTIGVTPRSRLLAVVKRDMTIGLVVDVVTEIRTMGDSIRRDAAASAPAWAQPFTEGIAQADGRTIVALDPERLLFSDRLHRYRAD
ncbi:MAG TPA: chemotaxis protein CheW [Ktedonobacterales bacterium]|jgi:purine-binding chemotaxis protein CheW|nr:chemotaxis protein CheW [Ktedonobacterales bacterium]